MPAPNKIMSPPTITTAHEHIALASPAPSVCGPTRRACRRLRQITTAPAIDNAKPAIGSALAKDDELTTSGSQLKCGHAIRQRRSRDPISCSRR
jgi:hypothetical protein